MRYSLAWPSTKIRPITKVIANHRRSLKTSPFSAANTPHWQVKLDDTRKIVNGRGYAGMPGQRYRFTSSPLGSPIGQSPRGTDPIRKHIPNNPAEEMRLL